TRTGGDSIRRPPRSLRMRPVKSSLSRLLVIPGILLAAAALASEGAVDPRIFAGKAAEESASFLVVMREQADLSGADALRGKAETGWSVSQALASRAEASQAALRAELDARGIPYRSFYLVNMLEVTAPRAVAEELANRGDVSSIAPNPEVRIQPQPVVSAADGSRLTADEALTVEPNIAKIGAPDVWSRGFTAGATPPP